MQVVGAGRTDAGVHAKQLYAHFDYENAILSEQLVYRLNAFLPEDIAVINIRKVNSEAHARFNATARSYDYWVVQQKNPFYKDSAHLVREQLNVKAMNAASKLLATYTDFECFSKSNTDVKTYLCSISKAEWKISNDKLIFTITADRFLRNMVRAIVGTLLEIGLEKKPVAWIHEVIKSKDRGKAGVSVPAKGLYLTKVDYPEEIFI
ncbi:tRNA pseudouridine synthase A [Croceivirga lutea]|nr:tRNA pseudouridine synthase A [Croceivirga lutea]